MMVVGVWVCRVGAVDSWGSMRVMGWLGVVAESLWCVNGMFVMSWSGVSVVGWS